MITVSRRAMAFGLAFFYVGGAQAQPTPSYYIDDGRSVQPVYDADASEYKASWWAVRLYKKGVTPYGPGYWGTITGMTADSVMQKLRSAQEFDKRYAKFFGYDLDNQLLTSKNYLGPIAIVFQGVRANQQFADYAKKVLEARELYKKSTELMESIVSISEGKGFDVFSKLVSSMPPEFGQNLKEMQRALADARERIHKLDMASSAFVDSQMTDFNKEFSAIADDFRSYTSSYRGVHPSIANLPSKEGAAEWSQKDEDGGSPTRMSYSNGIVRYSAETSPFSSQKGSFHASKIWYVEQNDGQIWVTFSEPVDIAATQNYRVIEPQTTVIVLFPRSRADKDGFMRVLRVARADSAASSLNPPDAFAKSMEGANVLGGEPFDSHEFFKNLPTLQALPELPLRRQDIDMLRSLRWPRKFGKPDP